MLIVECLQATESLKRRWNETLKVHTHPRACIPSSDDFLPNENNSEDCLYLNVFVPVGGAASKTVLLEIHGGGFSVTSNIFYLEMI